MRRLKRSAHWRHYISYYATGEGRKRLDCKERGENQAPDELRPSDLINKEEIKKGVQV